MSPLISRFCRASSKAGEIVREPVLVVVAHPDDEVLGCGGTIARHVESGDEVHILIVAEGATSRDKRRQPGKRRSELLSLAAAARQAAGLLGAQPPRLAGFPDNRLDSVDLLDLVKAVTVSIDAVKPRIVYTHHASDLNVDHRLVNEATVTACRPLPNSAVRAIYAFETVSSTGWSDPHAFAPFRPTRFVDISAFMDLKRRACECYETEMRPFPHARSMEAVEALARWRGTTVGRAAAEAFEVIREIT
jgi:N-acetylglucosamine malate deacetylase 1